MEEAMRENTNWRTRPDEITQFAEEKDYQAIVVGCGPAGLCACRELAERGVKVAMIEAKEEKAWGLMGIEFAAFNSKAAR
jgi:ribulose 1,5-bisphosphate synthetase/thiazole synthase